MDFSYFKEMKANHQQIKEKRKVEDTQKLINKGIEFESKNFGYHLIVKGKESLIDYWPSSGKFFVRKTKKKGNGFNNLMLEC